MSNFIDGSQIDAVLKIAFVALLLVAAVQSWRLARIETRLVQARQDAAEMALERDGVMVELVRSHRSLAELELNAADRQAGLRVCSALAGERQDDAADAIERFEAAADAHEARMHALRAADPTLGESRFETANRMIAEALKARPA